MSPTIDPEHARSQPEARGIIFIHFPIIFAFLSQLGYVRKHKQMPLPSRNIMEAVQGYPGVIFEACHYYILPPIAESLHRTWLWQQPGFIAMILQHWVFELTSVLRPNSRYATDQSSSPNFYATHYMLNDSYSHYLMILRGSQTFFCCGLVHNRFCFLNPFS